MSFKANIANSKDYNYNKSPHIYSYKYSFINNFIHFILNAFIRKSIFPFISIGLFILVIILNSIQYNNSTYLQDKIENSISKDEDSTSPQNALLYIYQIIGINAFANNGLAYIIFFLLTYICLGLVEMNIGHTKTFFFLVIILMFRYFIGGFYLAVCKNELDGGDNAGNNTYCCGSFILWASIGFTLFIIQTHISNLYKKLCVWFVIACVWGGTILFENYVAFDDEKSSNQKNCKLFFWHAANYVFGIFCALVLSN